MSLSISFSPWPLSWILSSSSRQTPANDNPIKWWNRPRWTPSSRWEEQDFSIPFSGFLLPIFRIFQPHFQDFPFPIFRIFSAPFSGLFHPAFSCLLCSVWTATLTFVTQKRFIDCSMLMPGINLVPLNRALSIWNGDSWIFWRIFLMKLWMVNKMFRKSSEMNLLCLDPVEFFYDTQF